MYSRLLRSALTSLALVASAGALAGGCLNRPVVPGEPATKTNFTTDIQEQAVDKLDILFSIDNSASMGDKQTFLEAAIPDLINRLVAPYCLTVTGAVDKPSTNDGTCPPNETVEFPPVHDMHIGIVSSSLGPRLSDLYQGGSGVACPTTGANSTQTINGTVIQDHNDDQAHLINRTSVPGALPPVETASTDAPNGFLAWFPSVTENNGKTGPVGAPAVLSANTLVSDFSDLVAGVHQYGCGIESQLENWYRFLIQPDPYATLAFDSTGKKAQWVGVDTTILQQRKDFLRPDSLVAIIVLTDENDSEIDVRSLGQQGYLFMSQAFTPPHGTAACDTNPGDPGCLSCPPKSTDPGCLLPNNPYTASTDWGFDLNLRHVHMKAKYGIDPQFPVERYTTGLTALTVPDRNGEYPVDKNGNMASSYQGQQDCSNPLYAAELPDPTKLSPSIATTISAADAATLCKLPAGQRATNLVFYAIIGGVPHQLLHFDPNSPTNSELSDADWVKILGNNPEAYDYSGIDEHMVESYAPRPGLSDPNGPNTADPINGREWITNVGKHTDLNVDREYSCIFPLVTPRDCTDPNNKLACDCTAPPGNLTPAQTSPVCDATNVQQQDYAKAYPTIRELIVAHKMGTQGIASSICPIDVTDATGTDPLYGYRPAVATIVNRLKNALTNQCLPQKLTPDSTGSVPCLILATLPSTYTSCTGTGEAGLTDPDPTVLAEFQKTEEAAYQANGGAASGQPDPATQTVCQVAQVLEPTGGSCKGGNSAGWCYVTGAAAGTCSQAILFTTGTPPTGSKISLQCIEQSSVGDAGQ
jgi:hypothetical protein